MAAPFNVPLPAPGDKPWNLNPAVEEVRSRIGAVNDLTTTGRLGEEALNTTIEALIEAGVPPMIATALADLDPELFADAVEAAAAGLAFYSSRGVLSSGTDLDTLTAVSTFGFYQLTSSGTYANRPAGTSGVAILEVFGSANAVVQRITHTGLGYSWLRNKLSAGSWSVWTPEYASRGALPTATNVGLMTGASHSGFYRLAAASTYTGIPTAVGGVEAVLEVLYASTIVVHRISTAAGDTIWQRTFSSGWSPWTPITPQRAFVGPADPETSVPSGSEYAWFKTDGNGNLIDILVGKRA